MSDRIGWLGVKCSADSLRAQLSELAGFQEIACHGPFTSQQEAQDTEDRLWESIRQQHVDQESDDGQIAVTINTAGSWVLLSDLLMDTEELPMILAQLSESLGDSFWWIEEPELEISQLLYFSAGEMVRSIQNDEGEFMTDGDPLPAEVAIDDHSIDLSETVQNLLQTQVPQTNQDSLILLVQTP